MVEMISPLSPGAIFQERYQIVRCIRAGGMGAVYEVIHLETKRRRALKVMLPGLVADADLRARFRQEATITADVETEHIVETFDAGVEPITRAPFLVMELLRGQDVSELLAAQGKLPAQQVVNLLSQLASALDKTHALGIVHRDLKPENLFVTRRDDGSPRLKVLDFGIAKIIAGSTQAKATARVGTPLYMAPEQLEGDSRIGPAADLYAMGHLAFTMLVGRGYWEEETQREQGIFALLLRVAEGAREPASMRAARVGVELDAPFDAWFAKATALRPQDRFQTACELVSALDEALGASRLRPSSAGAEAPPAGAVPSPRAESLHTPPARLPTQSASAATPTETGVEKLSGGARESMERDGSSPSMERDGSSPSMERDGSSPSTPPAKNATALRSGPSTGRGPRLPASPQPSDKRPPPPFGGKSGTSLVDPFAN